MVIFLQFLLLINCSLYQLLWQVISNALLSIEIIGSSSSFQILQEKI